MTLLRVPIRNRIATTQGSLRRRAAIAALRFEDKASPRRNANADRRHASYRRAGCGEERRSKPTDYSASQVDDWSRYRKLLGLKVHPFSLEVIATSRCSHNTGSE